MSSETNCPFWIDCEANSDICCVCANRLTDHCYPCGEVSSDDGQGTCRL